MYKFVSVYTLSKHLSLHEPVIALPALWLRKCFPKISGSSVIVLSGRTRFWKTEQEIFDGTDVFKINSVDRYVDRTGQKKLPAQTNTTLFTSLRKGINISKLSE